MPDRRRLKPEEELGKTAFLAHAGRGFAAFHVYVSKPLRRRTIGRPGVIRKAAIAASYASRELLVASVGAGAEKVVAQLADPLMAVSHRMRQLAMALRSGSLDAGAIIVIRNEVNVISRKALQLGQPIQEVAPKL